MEKIILLLDGTDATSNPQFLSNLVSMGIYNFTKNVEGIQYLYNTPNTYRDVAQFQNLSLNSGVQNVQSSYVTPVVPQQEKYITPFTTTTNSLNASSNVSDTRIIGVKNLTKQSGATSLVYMMKNELNKNYKVVALEVDKSDFVYFRDRSLISTTTQDVGHVINNNKNSDVILIDINNSTVAEGYCQDVLYLIEPSIIKLQKLMLLNAVALQGMAGKKIILNQSLLSKNEIKNFEYEARVKVFFNLIPLNERSKNLPELNELLVKLGFTRQK